MWRRSSQFPAHSPVSEGDHGMHRLNYPTRVVIGGGVVPATVSQSKPAHLA